ncbi:hypothetical protein CHU95_06600 [Niveispirillum lacus]|uniref:Type IV pilus biogenesis protein PilP n=1 Tax=Niveispirillum lacus TaxID=1981099 RepID=A0A255Z4T2_9PROT|nr:hypothetical protein [Niveispirillum lacus]OYQ35924.1 hypothetical protein CHU95_06600 [Niveispirillum lacus]
MRERPLPRLLAAALILAAPASLTLPVLAAGQDDVLKCLGILDNGARLACYDRTVPALRNSPPGAPAAPAAPTAPAVLPPVAKEQSFGAERITDKSNPAVAARPQEAEAITAKLVSISQQTIDRYSFTLDNGQIWTQVVARSIANAKPGKMVKIEKGIVGSFTMTIDGVSGIIKVRRVK